MKWEWLRIYQDTLTSEASLKGDVVEIKKKILPGSLKRMVTVGNAGRDGWEVLGSWATGTGLGNWTSIILSGDPRLKSCCSKL